MGASKSSKVVKTFLPKKKLRKEPENEEEGTKNEETNNSGEETLTTESTDEGVYQQSTNEGKQTRLKTKKKANKKVVSPQKVLFPNTSISNLSRGLGPNDWIRLANALGFLPQGIAHFTGRASSAQNSYSQCTLMLKTWRELTPAEEILPRLCDALRRIRRHDLAVKMGLELGTYALPSDDADNKSKLLLQLGKSGEEERPPYTQSKVIFNNNNVSFLARHLLAREEWKRLAYALGFYPDDVGKHDEYEIAVNKKSKTLHRSFSYFWDNREVVLFMVKFIKITWERIGLKLARAEASQIIASASSCQNLYAQAHLMLTKWRDQTPSTKIISSLRAAFIRIRRHDLVFLLDLGLIAGTKEAQAGSLDKLCQIYEKVKKSNAANMGHSEIAKFKDLLSL